ncbi:TPA: discoidin domain-containing protein, partial [Streptococcus suis]
MNRQDKNYQKLYQYSIRKRNWGVGSVVVGIFLAGMLQAPTVLANTGATASEPTIENPADTGGGATSGSEAAQPTAMAPAPGAENTTSAPTPAPADSTTPTATPAPAEQANPVPAVENAETRTVASTVRVNVPIDITYNGASSVDGTNVAAKAYDDDHTTYWTSDPNVDNTPEAPQYFVTKLKEPALVNQIDYTPRQASGDQVTGNISKMKLYSSQDGVSWEPITPTSVLLNRGTVNPDKSVTFSNRSQTKMIAITPVTAQYFKLEALLTEHWDTAQRNKRVTAAEFLPRGTAEKSSLDIASVSSATATSHDPNDGGNRPAEAAIDNENGTYWVSAPNKNNNTEKQYLELTLDSLASISHVEYLPRQSGGASTGNIIRGFIEYKESDSEDEEWKRINVYGSDNDKIFTLGVGVSRKFIQFDPVIAKKIRLGAVETHHHEQQNRGKIVAAAEFTPYARRLLKESVVTPVEKQEIRTPNPEMWVDEAEIVEDEGANGSTTVHKYYLTENGEKVGEPLREENGETVESRPRRVTYGTKVRPTEEPQNPGEQNPPAGDTGEQNPPAGDTGEQNPPAGDTGEQNPPAGDTGEQNPPAGDTGEQNPPAGEGASNQAEVGNYALVPVSAEKFTVIGDRNHYQTADGYQRGLDNILNADLGEPNGHNGDYLTELKWTGGPTLPVTVGFQLNTPQELNSVIIHKRVGDNGTLTHYKVKVYRDSQEVFETEELSTPQTENDATFDLSSFGVINKVELVFTKTVSRNDQVNLTHLTLKGVSFLEKSPIDGVKLPQSDFTATVEDPSKYHSGRDISKLLDDNNSTFAEYRWTDPLRLPERITIQARDNSPKKLAGFTLHKRAGQGGSVVKYNLETFKDGQPVDVLTDLEVPFLATYDHRSLSGNPVDTVILTVTEAKNRNNQATQTELTLRGLTFYEKVELPPEENPPAGDTGEQNPPAGDTGEQNPPAGDTGEQNPPAGDTGEQNPPAG